MSWATGKAKACEKSGVWNKAYPHLRWSSCEEVVASGQFSAHPLRARSRSSCQHSPSRSSLSTPSGQPSIFFTSHQPSKIERSTLSLGMSSLIRHTHTHTHIGAGGRASACTSSRGAHARTSGGSPLSLYSTARERHQPSLRTTKQKQHNTFRREEGFSRAKRDTRVL